MDQPQQLDPSLPIPLYYQLKSVLLDKIVQGEWPSGYCIPTESEFIRTYGVSRTTVREAVASLVREGYLSKKQGKGTFVNRTKFVERLGRLTGFAEEILQQGYAPSARLVSVEEVTDRSRYQEFDLAENLPDSEQGAMWVNIKRIRLADDVPIAVEYSFWPKDIGDLLCEENSDTVAFYPILERQGIRLHEAEERIAAINANRDDAKHLGVPTGTALIEMTRLTTDVNHQLIEYTKTRYRGDRYTYHVKLQR